MFYGSKWLQDDAQKDLDEALPALDMAAESSAQSIPRGGCKVACLKKLKTSHIQEAGKEFGVFLDVFKCL